MLQLKIQTPADWQRCRNENIAVYGFSKQAALLYVDLNKR